MRNGFVHIACMVMTLLISCSKDDEPEVTFFQESNGELVKFEALVDGAPFTANLTLGQYEVKWDQGRSFSILVENDQNQVLEFDRFPDIVGIYQSSGAGGGAALCLFLRENGQSYSSCLTVPGRATIEVLSNNGQSLMATFIGELVVSSSGTPLQVEGSFEISLLE